MLYQKLFTKITISQTLNKIFLFCKNWLVICILSFNIKANVNFCKKKCCTLPMALTITAIFILNMYILAFKVYFLAFVDQLPQISKCLLLQLLLLLFEPDTIKQCLVSNTQKITCIKKNSDQSSKILLAVFIKFLNYLFRIISNTDILNSKQIN